MENGDNWISALYSAQYYIFKVGTPIFLLIGLLGNSVAIITLIRMRNGGGIYFLIALSLADVGVLIGWSVFWFQEFFKPVLMDHYDWVCKCVYFEFYTSLHCSVSILVAMTTERFVAVCFPLQSKIICRKKHCVIVIGVIILIFLTLNCHNLFTRQVLDVWDNTTMCLHGRIATSDMPYGDFHVYVWPWIDAAIYSFVPITSIFVLNSLIIAKVKMSTKMPGKNVKDTQSKQLTRTLLIVSFSFLFLTLPIGVVLIVEKNWDFVDDPFQYDLWSFFRAIAELMELMNHSINFFLYCFGGGQFREYVKQTFCSCRMQHESPPQESQPRNVSQISGNLRNSPTVSQSQSNGVSSFMTVHSRSSSLSS